MMSLSTSQVLLAFDIVILMIVAITNINMMNKGNFGKIAYHDHDHDDD